MRQQTKNMQELLDEFKALKTKLFGDNMFVVLDETSDEVKRYNQLFQYFYPAFRTKEFTSPLDDFGNLLPKNCCHKCGDHFFAHNDDGSCVNDEEPEYQDEDRGGTGHGDISYSDADNGL